MCDASSHLENFLIRTGRSTHSGVHQTDRQSVTCSEADAVKPFVSHLPSPGDRRGWTSRVPGSQDGSFRTR
jgi:hypothetical protein